MTYQHTLRYLTEREEAVRYLDTAPLTELVAQPPVSPIILCLSHDKCGRIAARMLRTVLGCARISCMHAVDSDREEARERFYLDGDPIPPTPLKDTSTAIRELEIRTRRAGGDTQATAFPPAHRTAAALLRCMARARCEVLILESDTTQGGSPWLRAMCELLPKPPVCLTVVSPTDEGARCALSTIPHTTHSVISHACGQPLYRKLSDACARAGNLPLRIIPVTGMERSSVTLGSQLLNGAAVNGCRIRSGTLLAARAAALVAYTVHALGDHAHVLDVALRAGLERTALPGCAEPISILPRLIVDRADNATELAATLHDLVELEQYLPRPRRVWLDSTLAVDLEPWRAFADELYLTEDPYTPDEQTTSLWIGSAEHVRGCGYGKGKN